MNKEPISVDDENSDCKLQKILNEGYPNLVKWMIALSTGAIVFSGSLSQSKSSAFWQGELAIGLFF